MPRQSLRNLLGVPRGSPRTSLGKPEEIPGNPTEILRESSRDPPGNPQGFQGILQGISWGIPRDSLRELLWNPQGIPRESTRESLGNLPGNS